MRRLRMRSTEDRERELVLRVEQQKQEIERLQKQIVSLNRKEVELRNIIRCNEAVMATLKNNPNGSAWHAQERQTTWTPPSVDTSGTAGSYWP